MLWKITEFLKNDSFTFFDFFFFRSLAELPIIFLNQWFLTMRGIVALLIGYWESEA